MKTDTERCLMALVKLQQEKLKVLTDIEQSLHRIANNLEDLKYPIEGISEYLCDDEDDSE